LNKKIYLIRSGKSKFGGAEKYLFRLSEAFDNENIKHHIIHSPFTKFLPSWLSVILFNIMLLIIKNNKFYFSLDRIVCPDVYRAGDGVHKVFLSIENKSKFNLLHPTYLYLEKKCFSNAKSIIANSKMVKNEIIKTYDIKSEKIEVIYNGVEFKQSDYQKSFDQISREFQITINQPILLYVGSGFKRKGVEEFLKLISKLKNTDFKAFVVGKDSNLKYYKKLSEKLRLNNKLFFTGARTDVDNFYTISDIFLFPTHYDPFSNVILEAMSFENVVFTTCNNGASEILDDYFIMKKSYDENIIVKIDYLLSNPKILNKEKKKNRKTSRLFSIEKNMSETMKALNKIEHK
jgi:UDP-glucose:(heptosyl)LPS alpha-1,3-glucosyltransferase